MGYRRDPVREAAEAHTALVLFALISDLAESGDFKGHSVARDRIIGICRVAQAHCLHDYDKWAAKAKEPAP